MLIVAERGRIPCCLPAQQGIFPAGDASHGLGSDLFSPSHARIGHALEFGVALRVELAEPFGLA